VLPEHRKRTQSVAISGNQWRGNRWQSALAHLPEHRKRTQSALTRRQLLLGLQGAPLVEGARLCGEAGDGDAAAQSEAMLEYQAAEKHQKPRVLCWPLYWPLWLLWAVTRRYGRPVRDEQPSPCIEQCRRDEDGDACRLG
jgi:hypothetical protein